MTPDQKKKLLECLEEERGKNRPLLRLVVSALVSGLVVALVLVVFMLLRGASDALTGTITATLLGFCSFCFVALVRILACSYGFFVIRCAVILDAPDYFEIVKRELICFRNLKRLLDNVK